MNSLPSQNSSNQPWLSSPASVSRRKWIDLALVIAGIAEPDLLLFEEINRIQRVRGCLNRSQFFDSIRNIRENHSSGNENLMILHVARLADHLESRLSSVDETLPFKR